MTNTTDTLEKRLALFLQSALDCSWHGGEFDGADIQDRAEALGLIRAAKYDPAEHGPSEDAEPGDQWFVLADDLKAALQ